MVAGHLDSRKWPVSDDVDYFKMLFQRFLARVGGSNRRDQPGSLEFITNSFSLLMFAGLVHLHVIPKATVEALQEDMAKFSTSPTCGGDSLDSEGLTPPRTPSPDVLVEEPDTPALAVQLGMSPHASPEPTELSQSTSDDSENTNGKRNIKGGSQRDGRAREEPTKQESDQRWNTKAIRMYPSPEAQNQISAYFETCETKERECMERGCSALAPYWRKGRERMRRAPHRWRTSA